MKLYWIDNESRYVHRLSDIPKGNEVVVHEIPTDLSGLMAHLNELHKIIAEKPVEQVIGDFHPAMLETSEEVVFPAEPGPVFEPLPAPVPRDMSAGAVLARMDQPGIDVDGVVEAIAKAKGYALRRYSGAVAVRFEEMSKK